MKIVSNFINDSGLEFKDISSEEVRIYEYFDGSQLIIDLPSWLHVSKSGGHRIYSNDGFSWYIAPGWRNIKWKVFDGKPNFVK